MEKKGSVSCHNYILLGALHDGYAIDELWIITMMRVFEKQISLFASYNLLMALLTRACYWVKGSNLKCFHYWYNSNKKSN